MSQLDQPTLFELSPSPPPGSERDNATLPPIILPSPDEDRIGKFMAPEHGAAETQRQAAVAVYPKTGTQRRAVLDFILEAGQHGATDDEIRVGCGLLQNTARPRRNELMNDEWIEDSGRRRRSLAGKDSVVWVATDAARAQERP